MPRIPVAAELERSQINVSKGIVGYQAGVKEAASAELADTAGNVASKVGRMAQYYIDQTNKKDAKAALLNLKEKTLGLELDMSKIKGNEAYSEGNLRGQEDAFKIESDNAAGNLNASAKAYYDEESRKLGMNFKVATTRHGMVEEEHMNKFIYDKSASVAAQSAAQNWDIMDANGNYAHVNEQRENLRTETVDFFNSQGVTDPKFLSAEYQKRVSSMHLAVVDSMVEDKQMGKAKEYMAEYGKLDEITEADRKTMNDRIEPAVSYEDGFNTSVQAFDKFRAGEDRAEILVWAKAQLGDDKDAFTAFNTNYNRLRSEHQLQNDETQAAITGDYLDGSGLGKADPRMAKLKTESPKNYYAAIHQIAQEENRREGKAAPRATSEQSSSFYALKTAGKFDGPEGRKNLEIYKHKLGRDMYDRGVAWNSDQQAADKILEAKGLKGFTLSAREMGLAFPPDATTEHKTSIKGMVETDIKAHIVRTGNIPTPKEIEKIMFNQRESYTKGNDEWAWRDGTEEMKKYEGNLGESSWPTGLDDLMNSAYEPEERAEAWEFIKAKRLEFPTRDIDYDMGFRMYQEDKSKKSK